MPDTVLVDFSNLSVSRGHIPQIHLFFCLPDPPTLLFLPISSCIGSLTRSPATFTGGRIYIPTIMLDTTFGRILRINLPRMRAWAIGDIWYFYIPVSGFFDKQEEGFHINFL